MKYEIKLENVNISNEIIKSVEINILQDVKESYVNDKNRIKLLIEGEIFTKDNTNIKTNTLIRELIKIKDKYFDVNLKIDDVAYFFPKLYIYKLIQKFNGESGKFNLVLLQKFIGDQKEIEVNVDDNKN